MVWPKDDGFGDSKGLCKTCESKVQRLQVSTSLHGGLVLHLCQRLHCSWSISGTDPMFERLDDLLRFPRKVPSKTRPFRATFTLRLRVSSSQQWAVRSIQITWKRSSRSTRSWGVTVGSHQCWALARMGAQPNGSMINEDCGGDV